VDAVEEQEKQYRPVRAPNAKPGAITEYGVIKMLSFPYGFKTLLLVGVTSAGTAGAGEFLGKNETSACAHQGGGSWQAVPAGVGGAGPDHGSRRPSAGNIGHRRAGAPVDLGRKAVC
jgi:hypothetical protein